MFSISRWLPLLLPVLSGRLLAQADGIGRTTPVASTPVATGARVDPAPRVDGKLDDEAWRAAPPLSGFLQRDPREGQPLPATEVRIVTDGEAL
jgi:hypothetical protein